MVGTYHRNLDEKNRVIVPPKLRDKLGLSFYISLGSDGNLEIRNTDEFNSWRDKLLKLNSLSKQARNYIRVLLGNTEEVTVDKLGRFNLPDALKLKASITKEITFIGVGNKVELWSTPEYEKVQAVIEFGSSLDELSESMLELGLEL